MTEQWEKKIIAKNHKYKRLSHVVRSETSRDGREGKTKE